MQLELPTIEELARLDDKLADSGSAIFERPFEAARLWGDWEGALNNESWFQEAYSRLYPSVDFSLQSFLTLAVSARGISYFVRPPLGYGRVLMKPIQYVGITEPEVRRLYQAHETAFWELQWQATDATDLFMAYTNFHPSDTRARNLMRTALNQLTASSRQLVASELDASIPQGMAMAVELAGKSVLASRGSAPRDERRLAHDLVAIHDAVAAAVESPADRAVEAAISRLPAYVEVRYEAPVLTILEAQHLFADALFVISDFLRRTNHDQLYWQLMRDESVPERTFDQLGLR